MLNGCVRFMSLRSGLFSLILCFVHPQISAPRSLQKQGDETKGELQYVLGPDDEIVIRALDIEEITDKPIRIDTSGFIKLPMVGRVRATGMTIRELEAELTTRLKTYIQNPEVAVSVTQFRSQPVSVIGSVNNPGVVQLQGRKSLVEVLSMAGGLRPDAGHSVKITRRREWGPLPLPGAIDDSTGEFSVAEVNLKDVMEARNPEENILIRPRDVISIPRAELVYVIGEVRNSGGFVLNERETISVLQALSLAGGLNRTAASQNAKILRVAAGASNRSEIPIDLKSILAGKATDIALKAEDILFIPHSAAKGAALRTLETLLQVGTGMVIYRR